MLKRRRPLTGLRAYFYREKRPVFKYCTSSSEEDEIENTKKIPSSDHTHTKTDCQAQASSADSEDTKNKEIPHKNSSDSGEKKPSLRKPIF